MPRVRLKAEARRQRIVEAARLVMAMRGYEGSRTREIAQEAGVSEALLYRHFPSKESLYEEVKRSTEDIFVDREDAVEVFSEMEPSTDTLIEIVYFLMTAVMSPKHLEENDLTARLVGYSILSDGNLYRQIHEICFVRAVPFFKASFNASQAQGDIDASSIPASDLLFFTSHISMASRLLKLPEKSVIRYSVKDYEGVLSEAVEFALKGIGVKREVIEKKYRPQELAKKYEHVVW